MLTSFAMNAILLGVIGEYLARIYRQVKPGPLTIVDRFIDRDMPAPHELESRQSHRVSGIVLPDPKSNVEKRPESVRHGV
jgi:hypothetical protein